MTLRTIPATMSSNVPSVDGNTRTVVESGDRAEEKTHLHHEHHEVSPSSGIAAMKDDLEKRDFERTSGVEDLNEVQEVTPKTWLVVAVGIPTSHLPGNLLNRH